MVTHKFKIEDRRRKVATLLAQSMTEIEIAEELKVDQSTIRRSIDYLLHYWTNKSMCIHVYIKQRKCKSTIQWAWKNAVNEHKNASEVAKSQSVRDDK